MTCEEFSNLIVGYMQGELPPTQREFVDLHLDHCQHCRRSFEDLSLTQRQLRRLVDDRYHPQLTDQITAAINRRRQRLTAGAWLSRISLGATALGAVAAVFFFILLSRGRLPFGTGAGAIPSGTLAYTVQGGTLYRVDIHKGTATKVSDVDTGAGFITASDRTFIMTGGMVTAVDQQTATPKPIVPAQGKLVAASPDGRTVWLLRQLGERFAIDVVDVTNQTVSLDSEPKTGHVWGAIASADGTRLFLTATFEGNLYLKEIDREHRLVVAGHRLYDFGPGVVPLLAPDGASIYLIGHDRVGTVNFGSKGAVQSSSVPGVTPVSALNHASGTVLVAEAQGGILEVAPATGRVARRLNGPAVSQLAMSTNGQWLYARTGGSVTVYSIKPLRQVTQIQLLAG